MTHVHDSLDYLTEGFARATASDGDTSALLVDSISLSFGNVQVLNQVRLQVGAGEIHGLVGANGAGKSTLVKILTGHYVPSHGSAAWLWGEPVAFPFVHSERRGIVVVHQDLALVDEMTVLENFGVVFRFGAKHLRPVRWSALRKRVRAQLEEFGVQVSLDDHVAFLAPGVRAAIAIMRSLEAARRAGVERVLMILDEPTVYLPPLERDVLFGMVRRLVSNGHSAIFISHRTKEVLDFCDRVSVLRDGSVVSTYDKSEMTADKLVHDILGYSIEQYYPDPASLEESDDSSLSFRDIVAGQLRSLTMAVRPGEIVGVTGVPGSGMDDLPHVLAGTLHPTAGRVEFFGKEVTGSLSPRSSRAAGIIVVPANRHRDAIWLEGTATENLTLGSIQRFFTGGRLRSGAERSYASDALLRYGVRPPEPEYQMHSYSGGNQQRVVLGRALEAKPRILVLHEATQGVDAGGKRDILKLISSAAESGVAVVMSSSDFEELANVCHRVLVLRDGAVAHQFTAPGITEDALARAAQL